jgi:DNA-directed RNA polymerase specialized sigma24 family protein
MSSADPVTRWIEQVKGGQRAAVPQLLERYFDRLVHLARARLRGVPGLAGYDEDVALSAFKSLCLGAERNKFPQLDDRDDLWRLLAMMTVRKAIDLQRRRRPAAADPDAVEDLLSREPDPGVAAERHSNAEIAGRLGCVERSVERKLHRIRLLWGGDPP